MPRPRWCWPKRSCLVSHGLSRVAQYSGHLRNGRVNGAAVPVVIKSKAAAAIVDAQEGLAVAACELAVSEAITRAREFGISVVGVTRSHHCGVLVDHLRVAGGVGLVGLGFANAPAAMAGRGRQASDLRHQTGRGDLSAA